ncbi:MAG: hypothetical protein JWN15_657 [Firmicutes bacterium]|nr:hypothetical protein [Bacillota bacterium]
MQASAQVLLQIEELRRQLHQGMGAQYDPVRLQTLVPISQELDRLVVEFARDELNNNHEGAQQ